MASPNTPFEPSRAIEIAYERAIRNLISKSFPARRPDQALEDWLSHLLALSNGASFAPVAHELAKQMVRASNASNERWWRTVTARSHGRMMHRLIREELKGPIGVRYDAIIRENARLIRSIPSEVAQRLSANIAKAQLAGMRHEQIAKLLRDDFPRLTESRVKLIARTEVAKAATALTEARAQHIGINWFRWMTSRDARVRHSHRNMDGVLVSWDDPPSPEELVGEQSSLGRYLPGGCPNDRCSALPLLSLDDVTWPRRVFTQGRITQMPRAQFAAQFVGVKPAA
jgi:SPP1 gp7 family putative phage head morphogenesis protein